jgi:RNA polymerase sigma factor (sigma-70 family)
LRRRLRSETRRARAVLRLAPGEEADLVESALDRVEAEALGPKLAAALAQLTPVYRDALLLHVWGDLSYEQVAAATRVSVGTVRSRIHRARAYIRSTLQTEEIL